MKTRTWPYGTKIEVVVVEIVTKGNLTATICKDTAGEGYILIGDDAGGAQKGAAGTITFTQGGVTGAYWKFAAK